ncbi:MAG TPA: histidine kinase [Candidatus Binataceae bacterium]|nr:histidine kinase [Candidatus Binataceae bacterium]
MKTADLNDLDQNIAVARTVLSVLALTSWYVDPSDGGWFSIDTSSLIVLSLHLAYSSATFVLIRRGVASALLPGICTIFDIAFAALITFLTEGPTSPSWLFFVFAIVAVDARTSFRAALAVTISSALVYFVLLAAFIPGPKDEYLMRSAYLAIIGYLVGFIGAQRARFEARVHDLEAVAERHAIARALHDGYVQALAGVNLRLETCRALMQARHSDEALAQITDLQKGVTREYDAVRDYIRSLAADEQISEHKDHPFAVETLFEMKANFVGRAPIIEQILQIVLEGVRNTWQHGKAACAAITISTADHLIRIAMDDDGVGFSNPDYPPWTIASRVAECGGRLNISCDERRGAHIEIEMPVA